MTTGHFLSSKNRFTIEKSFHEILEHQFGLRSAFYALLDDQPVAYIEHGAHQDLGIGIQLGYGVALVQVEEIQDDPGKGRNRFFEIGVAAMGVHVLPEPMPWGIVPGALTSPL